MKTRILITALGLLMLSGCTPPASTPSGSDDSVSSGGDATSPCFVGQWDLDLTHYQDDAAFFAAETGVPISSLTITGNQTLSISADGQITLGTNLSSVTVVTGVADPLTSTSTNLGLGSWTSPDEGTLTISDFSFSESTVRTSIEGAPVFSGCDFTEVPRADIQCEGDTLFIIGPDAPYGTYWTRR